MQAFEKKGKHHLPAQHVLLRFLTAPFVFLVGRLYQNIVRLKSLSAFHFSFLHVLKRFAGLKIYTLLLLFGGVFGFNAFAQFTVSGSTSANGNYTSLTGASGVFAALNATAQTSNTIVVTVTASSTTLEDGSVALGAGAWTSLRIVPVAGAWTISGTIAGALISFNGSDNVTIDGINSGGVSLTIDNQSTASTNNIATIKINNDATSNTINNCTILGGWSYANITDGTGMGGTIWFGNTGPSTGNDNNTISNNNIGPTAGGLPAVAIFSLGSGTSTTTANSSNTIRNNNIYDFFMKSGSATRSAGVYLGASSKTWTIDANRFYQTATRTFVTGDGQHSAIWCNSNASTTVGNEAMTITNNIIGYASSTQTGTYTLNGGNTTGGKFIAIYFTGRPGTGTVTSTISNNTIRDVSFTNTQSSGVGILSPFSAIIMNFSATGTATNTHNNIIGSQTETGNLIYTKVSDATPTEVHGISRLGGNGTTWNANGNQIGGITVGYSSSTNGRIDFIGMRCALAATGGTFTATSNIIGGSVANSIQLNNSSSTQSRMVGFQSDNSANNGATANNLQGNTIRNFTLSSTCNPSGNGTSAAMAGIIVYTTGAQTISNNTIYNLHSAGTSNFNSWSFYGIHAGVNSNSTINGNFIYKLTSAQATNGSADISGIYIVAVGSPVGTYTFSNNMISFPDAQATRVRPVGIYNALVDVGGTWNIYHNSVYIGGTTSGSVNTSPVSSAAYYSTMNTATALGTELIQNNIFQNERTLGTSAVHVIINIGANTSRTTLNNNIYSRAAGVTPAGFQARVATTGYTTFATWKSTGVPLTTGADAASIEGAPTFKAPTATTPDLHITYNGTSWIGNATGANLSATVSTDFDGLTRSGFTPHDIGAAVWVVGAAPDATDPVITYTPIGNQTCGTNPITLTVSPISDAGSGIRTSGLQAPIMYYKINSGSYNAVPLEWTSGTAYKVTFPAVPVFVAGDVISYYIMAQDGSWLTTNVQIGPNQTGASGFSVNPPAVSTPPSSPSTFTISAPPAVVAGGPNTVSMSASPAAITLSGSSVTGGNAKWTIFSLTPTNGNDNGVLSNYAESASPQTVTYTPPANYSGTVTLRLISTTTGGCVSTTDRTINITGPLYWRNNTTGSWTSGTNWSYAGYNGASCSCTPAASDQVIIDNSLNNDDFTISSVPSTVFGSVTTQGSGTGTVTLTGSGIFKPGILTINANTTLSFSTTSVWVYGSTSAVAAGKTLTTTEFDVGYNSPGTLFTVNGTLNVFSNSNGQGLYTDGPSRLVVANGGTLNVQGSGSTYTLYPLTVNYANGSSYGTINFTGSGYWSPTTAGGGYPIINGKLTLQGATYFNTGFLNWGASSMLEYLQTSSVNATAVEWPAGPTNIPSSILLNCGVNTITLTGGNRSFGGTLNLTAGFLSLGANNLTASGTISNASAASYIVTDGAGTLIRNVSASTAFPVGTATDYMPLSFSSDVSQNFNVRVKDPSAGYGANTILSKVWEISGSASTIAPVFTWATGVNNGLPDPVTTIQKYDGVSWSNLVITPSSTSTYTATYSGVSCCGEFSPATAGGCTLPSAAGTISGSSTVCQSQTGVSYSVASISGATSYTWSYSGTGFTPSASTASITGSFSSSATSGNLTVTGVNTCGNGTVSATYAITVSANNTAGAASSTQTVVKNSALTSITHTTTGATGISGDGQSGANTLPAGVSASWSSNVITISGTPTSAGTFTYSIPLTGGCGSVNATGTITVENAYTWNGSTSSAWNTAANWTPSVVPAAATNVIIPDVSSLNFAPVTSNLTIDANVTYTLQSNAKLTLSGNITNNGTLTIESGATLVQTGSGANANTGSGTYNVKQYVTGSSGTSSPNGRFWYLGSPLSNGLSTALLSNNNLLWQWNEGSFGYSPVTSGSLEQGRSYVLRSGQNETLNFSGTGLSNGTVTVSGLTRSGTSQQFRGCHLVSNPYPSYLDWNSVTKTNIGTTMYVRTAVNTTYDIMETFNSTGNVATNNSGTPLTQYIAPMQGFWVKVETDGQTGSLTMDNSMRSHQSSGVLRSTPQDFPAFLRFNMLDGQNKDQVILLMSPDASMSLDNFDSEKMSASGYAQFYSTVNAKKLVINGMKNVKAKTSVPLTLVMPTSKSYVFQAEEFNIEDGLILLEDKQEDVIQDLTINPTYSFFGNAGTNATRFVVHFQLASAPILVGGPQELESLGSEDLTTDNIQIISNNQGTVIVRLDEGFKPEGNIRVFDASGRLLEEIDFNDQETTIHLNGQAGMYFVEVSAGKLMVKKKIVIN